jgi:hypothetical protein
MFRKDQETSGRMETVMMKDNFIEVSPVAYKVGIYVYASFNSIHEKCLLLCKVSFLMQTPDH